jgi:hypothetical protein
MRVITFGDIGKAAIGAIITGIVAISVEISRRRRERKHRFQDDRLRIYKSFLRHTDLLFDDIQVAAAFRPIYRRLMLPSGERNGADVERG